jgi:peptidylprolyl isomerase
LSIESICKIHYMRYFALINLFFVLLALSGCGGGEAAEHPANAAGSNPSSSRPGEPLKAWIPKGPPPKKLVVKDLKVGSGPEIKKGERATVQYVGVAYKTGKQFSARTRNEPFRFYQGLGDEQPGWEKGLPGMRVGGRRELIIPPHLTFNQLGKPETLVYVIELLELNRASEVGRASSTAPAATWRRVKPKVRIPHGPSPSKLVVHNLKQGTGPKLGKGDEATVRYIDFVYETGEVYSDHWDPPYPITFELGRGELESSWEEGLGGMRVGGRRQLIVPGWQAYGEFAQIYVIELTAIK